MHQIYGSGDLTTLFARLFAVDVHPGRVLVAFAHRCPGVTELVVVRASVCGG